MNRLTIPFAAFLFSLLVSTFAAEAQTSASAQAVPVASNPAGQVVMVYLYALNISSYNPTFDIGDQLIGGLNSTELHKKFFDKSAAVILNFVEESGYRVVGFSAVPAKITNNVGGLEGYAVLMERVR